jgi:hypothetical protein
MWDGIAGIAARGVLGSGNPGQRPQRIAFRGEAGPQPPDPCNKVAPSVCLLLFVTSKQPVC